MKKSFVALIAIIQVLALFVFVNIYSLVKNLEKSEVANIIAVSEARAELHILKTQNRQPAVDPAGFFDQIMPSSGGEDSQRIIQSGNDQQLLLTMKLDARSGLLFKKTIQSALLRTLRSLKKILAGLIIFLGVFIIACGIYLVFQLRGKESAKLTDSISPFQDYLLEIKKSELELKSQVAAQSVSSSKIEELNKSIINTIHLAVIFTDAAGKVELFNPAAQKCFSRSFAAAKNNPLSDVLRDYPELPAFINRAGKKDSAEIESNGRIFSVDVVPVGESGCLAVIRDVSKERKREKIQRLNANQMMLGEMAAALAHEIRNSLGVILGYSKAILAEPEKTGKINREIHFLSAMMESFLQFAKPVEKTKQVKTALGPIIAACAAANSLTAELPEQDLRIESDPLLLNVIFSNLLLNASQAGAKRLRVEFSRDENAAITIRDDGPGIAATVKDKIWLPFFSTRDKGTGMGLATVKKIVGTLNGDIQLMNPGKSGAEFRIVFYN
ncbi:MAG: ATP-binding protein [Candidatus Aminicenantes bacterium]|nr:ATP-binding protein [Candidatus Aminicenantes bacterium]